MRALLLLLASCVVVHVHEAPVAPAVTRAVGSGATYTPGQGDFQGSWIPGPAGSANGACTLNATGWSSDCYVTVPDEFTHSEDNTIEGIRRELGDAGSAR